MVFKKKGQVTIFVIIGIVLVLGVFLFIFLGRGDGEVVVDDSPSARLEGYIGQCNDLVLDDFVPRALVTGGFGYYPFNIVRTETNPYVLSYSAEGVPQGVFERRDVEQIVFEEISNSIHGCLSSLLESELEIYNEEISLERFNYEVLIEQNVVVVTYDYEYSLQGNYFANELITTHSTNLGYFLDRTNELTDFFLETRRVDNLFNYQFCNVLIEEEGIAPKYSADFLRDFEGDEDVSFLFDKEFFIVFLNRGGEMFPFAIMPEHDGYFC